MALSIKISDKNTKFKPDKAVNPVRLNDKKASRDNRTSRKKKPKDPKKKKSLLRFVLVGIVLLLGAGVYFGISRVKAFTEEVGINIKPTDLINPIIDEPELKKDSSGERTNFLLVGIDTRKTDAGLQNTDTMIVASYSHEDHSLTMFSVPRDTYTRQPGTTDWYGKVNGVYNKAEQIEEGTGLEVLQETLEEYVGLEIQYYAMIDVEGLSNIIDIIGGVEINVENSFTDYRYPNETNPNQSYQTVSFEKGLQIMDGETLVQYVRSRKSLDNGEGSDYARARRQQIAIAAVQKKLLSTETLLSIKKITEIMQEVQNNLKLSDFTSEDMQAGLAIAQKEEDLVTHSFVLDPNIGSRKILMEGAVPGSYSVGPILGLGKYEDLHDFINKALEEPEFYEADPLIYTYNTGLGYYEALERTNELQELFPYTTIVYRGTLFNGKEGVYLYDNSKEGEFADTIDFLTQFVEETSCEKPDFVETRLNGEEISILYGADPALDTDESEE
jgi:LCP family protein required for cell wall assembly